MLIKSSWSRKILILSVALNVFFISVFGYRAFVKGGQYDFIKRIKSSFFLNRNNVLSAQKSEPVLPPIRIYNHRQSIFESLPDEKNEIIFLGDSFIDFAEWSELFNNPKIKNRGIAGDRTDGILDRLNGILASSPAKIFLMIGYNDLSKGRKIPDIVRNFEQIFENVRAKSPKTKLYVQSVLPVNSRIYKGVVTNRDIKILNNQLAKLCERYNAVYIDLFSSFCGDDDQLPEEFAINDGLHLNGKGYLKWKSILEKYMGS